MIQVELSDKDLKVAIIKMVKEIKTNTHSEMNINFQQY
jgi:hypothetical protein